MDDPITYILLLKGLGILIGVVLIILGYRLTKKPLQSDFEFTSKLGEKVETSLKGSNPGLFIMLLGVIVILVTIIYQIEVEIVNKETTEEEPTPAARIGITLPDELRRQKATKEKSHE